MEIVACQCEEGLGLAHSHVSEKREVLNKNTNVTFWSSAEMVEMNHQAFADDGHLKITGKIIPAHIAVWINWETFGKSLLRDPIG